jgi:hypothetical protein
MLTPVIDDVETGGVDRPVLAGVRLEPDTGSLREFVEQLPTNLDRAVK